MSLLEMTHISKAFGGSKALDDVHLTLEEGEVHALLGENGAGKSTLMNILTGVIEADEGSIVFDGKAYVQPTIRQMEQAGIAFVHQELNVINDLTVYENIFLRRELVSKKLIIDKKEEIKKTNELFERLGVSIDPEVMVSELKTSEKQLLEICRALYANAKLLILDEPTTSLSNAEIDHLFGIIRRLKENENTSFVFISHKMPEIFAISDRYTVFRSGKFISSGLISETTMDQVTSDMVGKQYVDQDVYEPRELGEVALKIEKLKGHDFDGIDLEIRKGEIVAITGLAGSGTSEMMNAVFGVEKPDGGNVIIEGKNTRGHIAKFMRNKLAMLPSNRKENSVIPDIDILGNMSIAQYAISFGKPFVNTKEELEKYRNLKGMLAIKAESPKDPISSLSGGNQQKVFFARWLNTEADVMLLDNPTQGVDVGAKAEIYRLILEFAKEGKAILINTLEVPEIMKVADRCAVFYDGKIVKIFNHDEINETDVMKWATNAVDTKSAAAVG